MAMQTGTMTIDETSGVQRPGSPDNDGGTNNDFGVGSLGGITLPTPLNAILTDALSEGGDTQVPVAATTTVAVSGSTTADPDGTEILDFTALGSTPVTDVSFSQDNDDSGDGGDPLDGTITAKFFNTVTNQEEDLLTADGFKIYLWPSDLSNDVVIGRKATVAGAGGASDSDGDIVFLAYLDTNTISGDPATEELDAGATGAKVWLVEFEPLKHPDGTDPDDAVSISNLFVTVDQFSSFSLEGAPSGQNLFLMFGDGTPNVDDNGDPADEVSIVVTATNAVNQSGPNADPAQTGDDLSITTGGTVNTGQGGGGTTLGHTNQMVDPTEALAFTFVTGSNRDYTVALDHSLDLDQNGNADYLDQTEADIENNIQFTGLHTTTGATFTIVQLQNDKAATLTITASNADLAPAGGFIDELLLNDDPPVNINYVKVSLQKKVGNNIVPVMDTKGTADPSDDTPVFTEFFKPGIGATTIVDSVTGITVKFNADGTVTLEGVEALDVIEYHTGNAQGALTHSRVVIANSAVNPGNQSHIDAAFDIGKFALRSSITVSEPFTALQFEDDGPTAAIDDGTGSVTLDETAGDDGADDTAGSATLGGVALTTVFNTTNVPNPGSDGADLPQYALSAAPLADASGSVYGNDGAGTTVLSLEVTNGNGSSSDLFTTGGDEIFLSKEGDLIVGRYDSDGDLDVDGDDDAAFAIALGQDGNVATVQFVSLTHNTPGDGTTPAGSYDEQVDLDGKVDVKVVVTDSDGDTDDATVAIGNDINFEDDGPTAAIGDGGGAVTIDETAGNQDNDSDAAAVLALFDTEVTTKGTDMSPAEFAISTTPLVSTTGSSYGQDEEDGTTVLSLAIVGGDGTDSLLDTTDGKNILLFKEGDLIVGRYDVANGAVTATDPAAFAIALQQDGNVAVAQYVSLTQNSPGDGTGGTYDEAVDLAGLVNAVVTVTDGDGDTDTDTFGIGDDINFEDDGPAVSANNTVLLDDDALSGNPGGTGDDADAANVSGTLGHAFGQDEEDATVAYLTTGAPTGFTYEASGTSLLVKQTSSGNTVLTLTMVPATGAYTVVQNNPIFHAAGLTENNQTFTINYQVTDGDGDTADGTVAINVDDDTPVVTAKSNLVYANASNPPPSGDPGGTGIFAYSIGADTRAGTTYSATNSDFVSPVTLTGTVGTDPDGAGPLTNAITAASVTWFSETDTEAVFNVDFTYVSNNPTTGATTTIDDAKLTFDKDAGTYNLTLPEIESFSVLQTSTPGNLLQGYLLNSATTQSSNPPVSVMTLASNFIVQFEGFGVDNGTAQTFAYDTTTGLFSNDRRYVTVSSGSIGAASDTLQSNEVIDLDFFTANPQGFVNSAVPKATSKAVFIEMEQVGPGAGKDLLVVLKLVNDSNPNDTVNRTFIVGNSTGNDDIFNANLPSYGFVAEKQNGIVVFESNDYNFGTETYSIQGMQVVTSTQGVTGSGYNLNGAIDDPTTLAKEGGTTNALIAFGGDTTEGNNEPIKIIDLGFVASTSPDAHLVFNVAVKDADGDATGSQTLDVTIVGGNGVTASVIADTFVFDDTDTDGLLAMVMRVIDGGFASGIDKLDLSLASSGVGAFLDAGATTGLSAFIAAADTALNGGTVKYYFADDGTSGYLAYDEDGLGITTIVQVVGTTTMVAGDII